MDPVLDGYWREPFTGAERTVLERHVTNMTGPVFALRLPQATSAALFARYSRSSKSLRRLLIDEFVNEESVFAAAAAEAVGAARARDLFGRVLSEYGDDSVAQLAGVHLACEQASQPLCKAIEWGRLAAYLEQSTRYIPYTDRRDGRFRYHLDPAVEASELRQSYHAAMDGLFETYAALLGPVQEHLDTTLQPGGDPSARRRAVRALALDLCRGLLPAGTVSNLGVFASPQAMEALVLRLRAHPLPEAQAYAELIAAELRRVIPDFVTRLDRSDRGGVWVDYLRETAAALQDRAGEVLGVTEPARHGPIDAAQPAVRLVRFDRDAEEAVMAAALWPHSDVPSEEALAAVRRLDAGARDGVMAAAVGDRRNRRHRPGRAFEHAEYTFEITSDYGAFRDLQRHRLLTVQWQELTCAHGYEVPDEVRAVGMRDAWVAAVSRAEEVWTALRVSFPQQSAYVVTLGHRLRYQLRLNAREAMHLVELRSSPQGHRSYRRVAREIHRQIGEVAGHQRIAAAMRFVGQDDVHLPRYASEATRAAG